MAVSKWIYTKSTGQFTRGGFYDPPYDPESEGVVEFQDDDPNPDVRLDRFDPVRGKRPATAQEIAAYDAAAFEAQSAAQLHSDPALTCGFLALHTHIIGRIPTEAEQADVFRLAKAFYSAFMIVKIFPLPPSATSGIQVTVEP